MKKTTKYILGFLLICLCGIGFFVVRGLPQKDSVQDTPQPGAPELQEGVRIIAFGDSLTAGYGVPLVESYPAQLEALLRERGVVARVINAGVSGETTAGARERAAFIRSQNPAMILVGIGGNDALRAIPIENTRRNLDALMETLTEGTAPPTILLLRVVAPQNAGLAYKEEFDALYPALSERYGLTLVPFVEEEVFRREVYLLPDGIHPNREGYAFLVERYVAPAVLQSLPQIEE
jgi:acyl-CoA thioesterase-1